MPTNHRELLARIRRFDQLVVYLRDELGWPIDSEDFEELTFEYTPEELGIDVKNAAKDPGDQAPAPTRADPALGHFLREVRAETPARGGAASHPRPSDTQEARLGQRVGTPSLGRRTTCSSSPTTARERNDTLPSPTSRRLKMAETFRLSRFSAGTTSNTPLHLDAVARELTEHLAWPEDEGNTDAWRDRWRAAFKLRHREVISTSKQLSERLADLARAIRDRTRTALAIETESGPLTKLLKAFQTALVNDLDDVGFADMYAQTIAYGLLSARITDPAWRTADDFAVHMRANPFLKELMDTFLHIAGRRGKDAGLTGIDFDELGRVRGSRAPRPSQHAGGGPRLRRP